MKMKFILRILLRNMFLLGSEVNFDVNDMKFEVNKFWSKITLHHSLNSKLLLKICSDFLFCFYF